MTQSFFKRLLTPNEKNEEGYIAIGFCAAFVISLADYMIGSDIQLHFLYPFPIALVALHADKKIFLFGIFLYSNLLQTLTVLSYGDITVLRQAFLIVLCLSVTALSAYFSSAMRKVLLQANNKRELIKDV